MRVAGFRWVHGMNSLLRLCLCLVLVGVITAGAIGCIATSSAGGTLPGVQVCKAEPLQQNEVDYALSAIGGNEPVIQLFVATPMELDSPASAAVYTFKVKRATNVQISEAGTNIKNISNPSGAALNGTADGLPAAAILTDDSGKFVCTIVASNEYGTNTAALELSLAANLIPAGQSGSTDNRTEPRSPKWLAQYSPPFTLPPSSIRTGSAPEFFICPSSCEACLKPEDAASRGYTQKCSEELCYYSPDKGQKWYCYSEPEGWCCANGKVSQSTKTQCAQVGGYWSLNQNEAIQACQPIGWCCMDGNLYQATRDQCAQMGGSYWSTNQAQVMENCRQAASCWCCASGKVFQSTQAQCSQYGGACYSTQSQATAGCRLQTPTYLR
jgi:hypothetical protein